MFPTDDKYGSTISSSSTVPVWIYVIFRKNPSSGHEKIGVNVSSDGPVFWDRHVVYVFCCSCHFEKHERELTQLLERCRNRLVNDLITTKLDESEQQEVERVCLVDRPVDYPFLPDSLFSYMANALPKLQFVYLRELDLEKINRATVEKLSKHAHLKKLIVHGCRNYEALQDFHNLPQLLVVKGEIVGLKAMLGDLGDYAEPAASSNSSASTVHSMPSSSLKSSSSESQSHPNNNNKGPYRQSSSSASSQNNRQSSRLSADSEHDRHINTPSPVAALGTH